MPNQKKTKASGFGTHLTEIRREQLETMIARFIADGVLPNGQSVSGRNVASYLLTLPNVYLYTPGKSKRLKPYNYHGLYKCYLRVLNRGTQSAETRIDIKLSLSDEFDFVDGEDDSVPSFKIPEGSYRLGIINDIHIPYHDNDALKIAINHLRVSGVNKILINGDLLDFYGISRFHKNPTKIFVKNEIELGKVFFEQLRKLFPSEQIIYKYGNHDSRLMQYIFEKAPALYGLDALNLSELLCLKEQGVSTVTPEQLIVAGKLNILHGHEFPSGAGVVNVARTFRLRAGDNVAVGHFHRTQTDIATTLGDKTHGSFTIGCLCNLRPKWYPMAYTTWNHGFAIVDIDTDGTYQFTNHKIINGRVV